ncbi:META domain-containing protein [Ruegeria sp. HKCCA4633]|uniref:META domain-containing protein n=1 Tax=Ruegeria sp. HKCCA4633 TaxID=2682983 RepID=UPI0035302410
MFRSTTATPVLTRGAPNSAELVLEMMPRRAGGNDPEQSIYDTAWEVYEIAGCMLIAENPPSLTIDQDGQFGLYGGRNRFTGTLDAAKGEFSMLGNFAGTKMACPEEREKLEQDTIKALSAAVGYVTNGANLALKNAAGATVLRLRKTPELSPRVSKRVGAIIRLVRATINENQRSKFRVDQRR